jgi:tRNA A37 N6-isopentenylltransferase MiaA
VNALFSFLKDIQTTHTKPRLRFPPIIVWVSADRETLFKRVKLRIRQMVSEGGLKEALDLFEKIKDHNFEKGLL